MQTLTVIIILALAVVFLGFTFIRSAKKPGCGSCSNCARRCVSPESDGALRESCCLVKTDINKTTDHNKV